MQSCRRLQDYEIGAAGTLPAEGTLPRGCCRVWRDLLHSQSMLGAAYSAGWS